jgi:hypothetical protein
MERRRRTWPRTAVALVTLLMTLAAARLAAADTLTLMWDPSPGTDIAGYFVHIGTQPGTHTQTVDVGPPTSYVFSSAVPGQQYCFAVSAYTAGAVQGAKSAEVCGYSNQRPTLTNPGAQSSAAGQPSSLQLLGVDPDGLAVTYSTTGLPAGLTIGSSTGYISGTPLYRDGDRVGRRVDDVADVCVERRGW